MTDSTFTHIQESDIKRFAVDALLAANVSQQVAELTAHVLWITSIRGVDSHGMRLLPHYVDAIQEGRINPQPNMTFSQTALATGIFDADHTLGHAASTLAMEHAIRIAQEVGIGIVVVKNSSHNGAQASYGLQAAQNNMIGMVVTNASPSVRITNSTKPFFGTNPICFTAPMLNEDPFCFDAAPTPYAFNKVIQYREDGKTLPEGIAADKDGYPTTDAELAFQLIPIGDYKGFGLIMMVDMLSSLLTGMPSGDQVAGMFKKPLSNKRYLAHFFMAIRIDAFRDIDEFKRDMQSNADKIRNLPRMTADVPVMIPGDPEKATHQHRIQHGIPVKSYDMERFMELAKHLKITPPQPM